MKLLVLIGGAECVSLLVGCLLIICSGCAQKSVRSAGDVDESGKFELKLKGKIKKEHTKLVSLAHTKTFLRGKIRHEKMEEANFMLQSELTNITNDGILSYEIRTIKKEGFVNLREMAFPELGEALLISYQNDGRVIQAGQYSSDSIFYVPPISLPKTAVNVGDTWKLKATWMSSSNKLPLSLSILTIFKEVIDCEGGSCARLEITGAVDFGTKALQKINFKSQILGEILFHIEQGRVVRSEMHNLEMLETLDTEVVVKSCLRSEAASYGQLDSSLLFCKPKKFDGETKRPSIFQKYY